MAQYREQFHFVDIPEPIFVVEALLVVPFGWRQNEVARCIQSKRYKAMHLLGDERGAVEVEVTEQSGA